MELCQAEDFACNRNRAKARKMSSNKRLDRKDLMNRFEAKEAYLEKMNDMDVFSISHRAM